MNVSEKSDRREEGGVCLSEKKGKKKKGKNVRVIKETMEEQKTERIKRNNNEE